MNPLSLSSRLEKFCARGVLNLPPALLRILAGKPEVRDGQTLDVQIQLMLRLQRLRGESALGGSTPEHERRTMDVQARLLEPEATGEVHSRNIQLAGADNPIGARLYRPAHCATPSPALVFYHGGGFVIGSLDSHDGICRALADRAGCTIIAVDYRLAPEHKAPAAVEDAIAAFRDIAARADELNVDANRLAVGGDSAGGNLAAVVTQQTRAETFSPCFQLLFYPAVDFAHDRDSVRTFARGFLLEKSSMDWFRGHYVPGGFDKSDPRVSPIYGDLTGLAPALIITGGFDPLRDEGEAYARALTEAGVDTEVRRLPGMIHGFLNFAGAIKAADAAITESARILAKRLATHGKGRAE